jgi:hypothetical protein
MTVKITSLAAAAALLLSSSAIGFAQAPKSDQMKDQSTMSEQDKNKKKSQDTTGASTPVPPGGVTGSASGTTGTDKKPGEPSDKTR